MMKRVLVTTADVRSWPKDTPILFLGKWCCLYDRKHEWVNLDAEVVPYHWDDRAQYFRDSVHLQNVYEQMLGELKRMLNEFHGVQYSLRYWRILVGPWLYRLVQTLFDRW